MTHRRKTYYTDYSIQGRLIVALLTMEFVLVVFSLAFLYSHFSQIIDDQLYRIHSVNQDQSEELVAALVYVLSFTVVINVIALLLAYLVWAKYVNSVLSLFREQLEKTGKLNFASDLVDKSARHYVLDFLSHWQTLERNRCLRIRALCKSLHEDEISGEAASLVALGLKTAAKQHMELV